MATGAWKQTPQAGGMTKIAPVAWLWSGERASELPGQETGDHSIGASPLHFEVEMRSDDIPETAGETIGAAAKGCLWIALWIWTIVVICCAVWRLVYAICRLAQ